MRAVSAFRSLGSKPFLTRRSSRSATPIAELITTNQRPENCSLADYYVFPPNLAWTMAFTHEDGWLGPYFARHRDFEALDRENDARVRKEREAEAARLKGWS